MTQTTQAAQSTRRLSVITIDQAIAGGSNVLVAVLAARSLSAEAFGLFGIVFLVYVMLQGVARALVCDPLLVHPLDADERPGDAIGTSCMVGAGLAVVVAGVGVGARLWDHRLGDALLVLAVCVPLLVLQDLGRYIGFATQRAGLALVLDTVWLLVMVVAVAGLLATDHRTLPWFIAAWAGTGALAGLLLFSQHRGRRIRLDLAWLRYTWVFSWRYLVSYSSTQATALAASGVIGGVAGARALGGVQGATLLVRPYTTFQVAAMSAGVTEVSRSGGRDARHQVARMSALMTAAALLNLVVLVFLPDRIGHVVLGASWTQAEPLLLPTAVQIVFLGALSGVRAGLLGLRLVATVMKIDMGSAVIILSATGLGVLVDGASGALWAVALVQGALVFVWWSRFLNATEPTTVGRHARVREASAAPLLQDGML